MLGLHEFGHVYHPDLGGSGSIEHSRAPREGPDDAFRGVCGELIACVWALEHSRVPVTPHDRENARAVVLAYAEDGGWTGGDPAYWMPEHLREPMREGMARLKGARGDGERHAKGEPTEDEDARPRAGLAAARVSLKHAPRCQRDVNERSRTRQHAPTRSAPASPKSPTNADNPVLTDMGQHGGRTTSCSSRLDGPRRRS